MPSEPVAVTDVLSELNTNWNASNVVKPQLIEMTGATDSIRINLNRGDYLIARPGSPTLEEIPVGNWKYVNRSYGVQLEISSKVSRQRLYDLMAEVRRICHARRHNMTNFQRLQFSSFNEMGGEDVNVWVGVVEVLVVNTNILAET